MTRCVYVAVEIWSMLRLWESIALMKPSVKAEKLTQPISQAGEYATYGRRITQLLRLCGSIAWLSIGFCNQVPPSGE